MLFKWAWLKLLFTIEPMCMYICPAHLKTYKHVIYYLEEQKPSNYLPLCYKIQGDNIIPRFL